MREGRGRGRDVREWMARSELDKWEGRSRDRERER